jgi:hypothetical protein
MLAWLMFILALWAWASCTVTFSKWPLTWTNTFRTRTCRTLCGCSGWSTLNSVLAACVPGTMVHVTAAHWLRCYIGLFSLPVLVFLALGSNRVNLPYWHWPSQSLDFELYDHHLRFWVGVIYVSSCCFLRGPLSWSPVSTFLISGLDGVLRYSNFCPHRLISQLAFLELWHAHGVQRSLKSRLLALVGVPLPVESFSLGWLSFFFTFTEIGRESDNCQHASTIRTLETVEKCEPRASVSLRAQRKAQEVWIRCVSFPGIKFN